MLTSQIELYTEALNLGVTIDTTDPDQLSYDFWTEKNDNGRYRHVLEITENAFQTDFVLPFELLCKQSLTHATHKDFAALLTKITGKQHKLMDSDIEEFRDLIDAICNVKISHENKELPWDD